MAQSVNLNVALGASKTGLAIGYRLLNLDGTTQAAFTTTNVVEQSSTPGTYFVTVPVSVADAGARIVWGISGTDYVSGIIDIAGATKASIDSVQASIAALSVIPVASAGSGNVGGELQITRASSFEATLSGIAAPSGWTAARLTVKRAEQIALADSVSILQMLVTNPGNSGTDGIVVLNGAAGGSDRVGGSIVIDTVNNEVDIVIDDDTTAQLPTGSFSYDIKFYWGTSKSGPPYVGTLRVSATPTQTIIPR
jgi:hypothetical protein